MTEDNFKGKRNTNGFDKRPEDARQGGRKPSFRKELERLISMDGLMRIENIYELEKSNGKYKRTGNSFSVGEIMIPTIQQILLNAINRAASSKDWKIIYEIFEGRPKQSLDLHIDAEGFSVDLLPHELLDITEMIFLLASGKQSVDFDKIKVMLEIALKKIEENEN